MSTLNVKNQESLLPRLVVVEDKVFDIENDIVLLCNKVEKLEATIDYLTRVIEKVVKVADKVTNLYVEGKQR